MVVAPLDEVGSSPIFHSFCHTLCIPNIEAKCHLLFIIALVLCLPYSILEKIIPYLIDKENMGSYYFAFQEIYGVHFTFHSSGPL